MNSKSLAIQTYLISWIVSAMFAIITFLCDVWEFGDLSELPYLALVVGSLAIGINVGLSIKSSKKLLLNRTVSTKSNIKINRRIMIFLVIMAAIGGLSMLISSGGFTGDLEGQRSAHVSKVNEATPLAYLGQFGISLGYICASLLPWSNQSLRTQSLWGSIMCISFILASLSSGGRVTMLIGFILFGFSLLLKNRDKFINVKLATKIKVIVTLVLLVGFTIIMLGYWSAMRGESYTSSVFMKYTGKIHEYFSFLNLESNSGTLMTISVTFLYLITTCCNGILNFAPFYTYYNPVPLYGTYQLDFVFIRFGSDWFKNKDEMENLYAVIGLQHNVWGTFVREFVMDFGWVGAIVAALLLGYFISKIEKKYLDNSLYCATYVFLLCWLLMSPFYSVLIFRPFQISCLMILLASLYSLFKTNKYITKIQ